MKRWTSVSFAIGAFFGAVAVSLFGLTHLPIGSLNVPAAPVGSQANVSAAQPAAKTDFTEAVAFFRERGITLSSTPQIPLNWASWQSVAADDKQLFKAAKMLQSEWSKYPMTAAQNSGLQAIYLVNNLIVTGQARSGMPEPDVTKALYFDISDVYLSSEDGNYMRRTFHHEFSHFIVYTTTGTFAPADTRWLSCNAKTAVYGNGGAAMYSDPDYAHKMHPSYGFIDGYATSGLEEDIAEMYAFYMTDPNFLRATAQKDAGIACKLAQTQTLVQQL